jgi:hypothetical protein
MVTDRRTPLSIECQTLKNRPSVVEHSVVDEAENEVLTGGAFGHTLGHT